MKNIVSVIMGFLLVFFSARLSAQEASGDLCDYDRASMQVVMRFEIKVKPEYVDFLKQSFDACKKEVLAKEPGCLDYSMWQSYNDSTVFCITETWATKADHNKHMQLEHTKKHIAETRDIRDDSFKPKGNYVNWVCPGANARE